MRFENHKTSALKSEWRKPVANPQSHGFTLIELLTATAIIAILIGLLLPAIQKVREEYAKNMAAANLQALLVASNEYFNRTGALPDELDDLAQFCASNPGSCSLSAELLSGRAGGYIFAIAGDFDGDGDVDGADFLVVAEPESPGITGSVTLTIDRNGVITSSDTPGADAARQRVFDGLQAKAAGTMVELLAMDPNASSQIRDYTGATTVNPGTLSNVFSLIDADYDGTANISEISHTYDGDLQFGGAVQGFLAAVYRDLKWDGLGEQDRQSIGVQMTDLDPTQPLQFTYDGLGDLTRILIQAGDGTSNTILLAELLAKLDAAEAAEAAGNLNRKAKMLKQYRKMVKAEIGRSLTRANANTLLAICNTL